MPEPETVVTKTCLCCGDSTCSHAKHYCEPLEWPGTNGVAWSCPSCDLRWISKRHTDDAGREFLGWRSLPRTSPEGSPSVPLSIALDLPRDGHSSPGQTGANQ